MAITVNDKNLGHATAYAYAVAGGYTGTEAEFTELLGDIATTLAELENLSVTITTLPAGSQATASYADGVLRLGIPKGDKGDTGTAATVTVGLTTTLPAGSDASVTNSGTSSAAVLQFGIPKGDPGEVPAAAIAPTEASPTASQAYAAGDYFWLSGSLHMATAAIAAGGTITAGTNCQLAKIGDDVSDLKNQLNDMQESTDNILYLTLPHQTHNGVTADLQPDGTYLLNGTASNNIAFGVLGGNTTNGSTSDAGTLPAGTYSFGWVKVSGTITQNSSSDTGLRVGGNSTSNTVVREGKISNTVTLDSSSICILYIKSGVVLNNYRVKVWCNKADVLHDFAPYKVTVDYIARESAGINSDKLSAITDFIIFKQHFSETTSFSSTSAKPGDVIEASFSTNQGSTLRNARLAIRVVYNDDSEENITIAGDSVIDGAIVHMANDNFVYDSTTGKYTGSYRIPKCYKGIANVYIGIGGSGASVDVDYLYLHAGEATQSASAVLFKQREPLITIVDDDGYSEFFDRLFDSDGNYLLHAPICPAMIGIHIGDELYMTADQLKTVEASGCEILGHGSVPLAPPVSDSNNYSLSDMERDVIKNLAALNNIGIYPRGFIYPSGATNVAVREMISRYYEYAATTIRHLPSDNPYYDRLCNFGCISHYALNRGQLFTSNETLKSWSDISPMITDLVNNGGWLILYMHLHKDTGETATAASLNTIIDNILAAGVSIVNASEAFDIYKNVMQSGDYLSAFNNVSSWSDISVYETHTASDAGSAVSADGQYDFPAGKAFSH